MKKETEMNKPYNPTPQAENTLDQGTKSIQPPEPDKAQEMPPKTEEVSKTNPKDKASVYSLGTTINIPKNRSIDGLTMSLDEFHYMKNKIKKISCSCNDLQNWSFAAFSVAGSAFVTLISFCQKDKIFELVITIVVMAIGLISGFVLRFFAKKMEKTDESTKIDVNAYLNIIERKFYDVALENGNSDA